MIFEQSSVRIIHIYDIWTIYSKFHYEALSAELSCEISKQAQSVGVIEYANYMSAEG